MAEGHLEKERGRIELPWGKKEGALNQMEARADGLPAVTDYQVLERRDGADLVSLRLKTGRTHQIRVHMAALGHPLLGDGIYGGDTGKIGRAALHCRRARVIQPFTRQKPGDRGAAAGGYEETAGKRGSLKKKRRTGGRL